MGYDRQMSVNHNVFNVTTLQDSHLVYFPLSDAIFFLNIFKFYYPYKVLPKLEELTPSI